MTDYEKQAEDFLKSTGTTFKVDFLKHGKHFNDDTEERDIYLFTFTRGGRTFKGKFGQSLANRDVPTAYDVLSCLTKYEVGTFKDFCSGFGYDEDSITAHKTYDAVLKEWGDVQRIWTDEEIEKMQEIQ